MMPPDPIVDITDEQLVELTHKLKNANQARDNLRSICEMTICDFAGITYDPVGNSHAAILRERWNAIVRLQREQATRDADATKRREAREKWMQRTAGSVWDKFVTLATGVVIIAIATWLADKFGIKLPSLGG